MWLQHPSWAYLLGLQAKLRSVCYIYAWYSAINVKTDIANHVIKIKQQCFFRFLFFTKCLTFEQQQSLDLPWVWVEVFHCIWRKAYVKWLKMDFRSLSSRWNSRAEFPSTSQKEGSTDRKRASREWGPERWGGNGLDKRETDTLPVSNQRNCGARIKPGMVQTSKGLGVLPPHSSSSHLL